MSIVLNGTTGITTPDIDSTAAPDFDGSNLTGVATAAQGALAATALQPDGDGSGLTGIAGTPAGAVIYHAANAPPTGFIKANGASLSTTTYADLFAAIGYTFGGSAGSFNVPDLRGEFIRSWDDGRGIDTLLLFGSDVSRVFGSAQAEEIGEHDHGVNAGSFLYMKNVSGAGRAYASPYGAVNIPTTWLDYASNETRPRNIALLACIKY